MTDEHLWLEEVDGAEALAWVREQNARSLGELEASEHYSTFEAAATDVLTTEDRIPHAALRGGFAYNFWQDAEHIKGIWRRSPIGAYLADDPEWETILDIDALAETEDENWVYSGAVALWRDGKPDGRSLVSLSIGGRDATTVREFDTETGQFIADGFVLPAAKQSASWLHADALLIATDWGAGTVTDSGYPSSVRLWHRGTAYEEATELFRGATSDVGVWPFTLERPDGSVVPGAVQRVTFFSGRYWLLPDGSDEPLALPIPERADVAGIFDDQILVTLQEDWDSDGVSFSTGDLVSFDLGTLLTSGEAGPIDLVFRPSAQQAIQNVSVTSERVLLTFSDNVASSLAWADRSDAGSWELSTVQLPGTGEAAVAFADHHQAELLISYQDFLTPDSQYLLDSSTGAEQPGGLQPVRSGVTRFDSSGLAVSQRFATSSDGTQVPYFLVHRADLTPDGNTPTLLYGYGGFEVSMTPAYSPTIGRLWLERGGAYALANIRGGGEFGPSWHQAGLKQKRQVIYDDFIAVAEELVATGVTSTGRLGIMGGSNGGLLMGVMLTQRPDLWSAVVIQVPLLDMLRYHLLLAGASWVDEYGSPDVADERAFLETLSPYHRFDASVDYPEPFFVTSTKDDRVHPGHARKMARLFEENDKPFLYFENIDGGHGAATTQLERARRVALEFTYLTEKLMDGPAS